LIATFLLRLLILYCHPQHNGIEGGWSYGLQATLDFNIKLKALGAYQTGADAYSWSGAQLWNHADTDAFGRLPLWESLLVPAASTVNLLWIP